MENGHEEARKKLLTPGPVELHPRVLAAMSRQVVSHRSSEFRSLFREVLEMLKNVYVSNEARIALLAGTGTTAVDAMVFSMVEPGDRVLLLSFGEFGKRMEETLKARGCVVDVVEKALGDSVSFSDIAGMLDGGRDYKALFSVYNETSTGARLSDIVSIARRAKERGMYVCIDAVSALAGEALSMDEWGLDAVASCSHKCIGGPPGVSFVALSRDATARVCSTRGKPIFLDLCRYLKFEEKGETPFTPALNPLYGLHEALKLLEEEGLQERWRRIFKLSGRLYRGAEKLGFKPFPRAEVRSHTIAALVPPGGISAAEVIARLERCGFIVAGGMGPLKGKIMRVGVMGYVGESDIELLLNALEDVVRGD
uniref:Alanine--glyoxylate aminotransferase family protein n=1 Tax=Fervidicoccus fontis TaxID=683846 RepID=A0A7J3ZL99_9CREN